MKKLKVTIKYILAYIIAASLCHIVSYAKTIDINGLRATLEVSVIKYIVGEGTNVRETKEFSNPEYETETKVAEDDYVKVELSIKNNNPYEAANIAIEEIAPTGFRQLVSDKKESTLEFKLSSNETKNLSYVYKYHKEYLNDQKNSVLYDEKGDIIYNTNDIHIEENDKNIHLSEENKVDVKVDDDVSKDLRRGVKDIIVFILAFLVCVILLMGFIMFYRAIKGKEDMFSNENPFKCLIIFLFITFIINVILNKITFANDTYTPQIYEYGKNYEKVIYEPIDFNGKLYRFAYRIYLIYDSKYQITDEDYEIDTDGDGLSDAFEYQYMTDKNKVDTDGDGLNDYIEVMILDYNPLSIDTFNDGVKDCDRDFDNDKLTNIEEINYSTDLNNIDTDYDALSDYDEINVHNTNPLNIDTDEDLLIDPDELKLGLDPTNKRTDGVTLDSERKIEQEYTITKVPEELRSGNVFISKISGKVNKVIDDKVKLSKNNQEIFSTSKSFVSDGFEIIIDDDDEVEIALDANKVSDRSSSLIIVKYDGTKIEAVETICENNILKAKVSTGVYVVMDSEIVLSDLNIKISDYVR